MQDSGGGHQVKHD